MTSTEQLERETEWTRAQLASTLDELRSITPGRVIDEALGYAKTSGGDLLRGLGHQMVEHPMSATLIGAGIACFLMSNGKVEGTPVRPNGNGQDRSAMETGGGIGATANSAMQSVKESAQSAAAGLSSAASSIGDTASNAYETVSDTARRTASSVKRTAWSVKNAAASVTPSTDSIAAMGQSVWDFCKDQPLVLAGLGLAIGAALGSVIPETAAEDRLMGETADQIKGKAQQLASEKFDVAKSVGEHMIDETAKLAKQELAQLVGGQQSESQAQGDHPNLPSDRQNADQAQQSGTEFRPIGEGPFH